MSFGDGVNPSCVAELETQVDHLKDVNGKLCAEINRQERVIEELRANAARLVGANDAMAERMRELESLLVDVWPYVWELRIPGRRDEEFQERFDELGIEVKP